MCRIFGFKSCARMSFMILLKPHSGRNLVLELNVKMLSSNQIAGFLNFNISKNIAGIKWIFTMYVHIY